ncbi:18481_t:CDS:10 [Rhizophagus irregularis]|nr:18481_t:CDS:10 [Rhizophagus irregularis]
MKKRSGNIKGKAEQPLVRQLAITKLPIIPIAETFSQEVQTSIASRILDLQNELQLLQKNLHEQNDLTNTMNPLSRRTSLISLDSMSQLESAPLSRSSLSSHTHSKSQPQISPQRPASQTYSQPQLPSLQDHLTHNLNDLESLKISQSAKIDNTVIMKPPKNQSKKVCGALNLPTPVYKAYRGNLRDLIKAGLLDLNSTWKKQDTKQVLRLINKFKAKNPSFPKTANNWAIKEMARGIINNRREYHSSAKKKRRENRQFERTQQKASNKVFAKDLPENKRPEKESNKENDDEILTQSEYAQQKMSSNKNSVKDLLKDKRTEKKLKENEGEIFKQSEYVQKIVNNKVSAEDFMPRDSDSDSDFYEQQFKYGPEGGEICGKMCEEINRKTPEQFVRKSAKKPTKRPLEQPEQPKPVEQLAKKPVKQSAKQPSEQPPLKNKKRFRFTESEQQSSKYFCEPDGNHPKRKSARLAAKEQAGKFRFTESEQQSSKNFCEPDGNHPKRKSARLAAKEQAVCKTALPSLYTNTRIDLAKGLPNFGWKYKAPGQVYVTLSSRCTMWNNIDISHLDALAYMTDWNVI